MSKQIAKILEATVLEGNLYEVHLEDSIGLTFDCAVGVTLPDGTELVHKAFYASGKGTEPVDPETGDGGFDYVAQSRKVAQAFADRINARGVIDLAYWEAAPVRESLEEIWAGYAREEQIERNGGRL